MTNNEVAAMFGKTILNSDNSESANAGSLEYRRGMWRYVDVTASYIQRRENPVAPRRYCRAILGDPRFLRR
ncbi:hypothetical protein ACQKRQ_14165 [Paraburkholderia sp. NPDC080076]|uniref:hypothetical protein n=1 Tax=Paraburkholderia sp. NPDC080076 TaxID=3390605 RepID=UPI003D032109